MQKILILVSLSMLPAISAHADYYKVYSPTVNKGELSAEADVNYSQNHRKELNHYVSQVYGLEYGVTDYWSTEISGEFEKLSGSGTSMTMLKWENVLAPVKPGTYWLTPGVYFEIEKSMHAHAPDNTEVKILLEKDTGSLTHTANIAFSHNMGSHAVSGVQSGLSWRTQYHMSDAFYPGVEYYSDFGRIDRDDDTNKQSSVIGPVLQGRYGEIHYDTGILFGTSRSDQDITFKLNLEYDF